MITITSKPDFRPCEEDKDDIIIIHYEPRSRTEGKSISFIRHLVKWFGVFSTVALGAAAFTPSTFNMPMNFRPWVFVTFIFWFFAFCAGFFNP